MTAYRFFSIKNDQAKNAILFSKKTVTTLLPMMPALINSNLLCL